MRIYLVFQEYWCCPGGGCCCGFCEVVETKIIGVFGTVDAACSAVLAVEPRYPGARWMPVGTHELRRELDEVAAWRGAFDVDGEVRPSLWRDRIHVRALELNASREDDAPGASVSPESAPGDNVVGQQG